MAAVKQEYDYNFAMFDTPMRAVRANTARAGAAPVRRERETRQPLKVVPKKSKAQRRSEARRAAVNMLIILVFAAATLGMLCLQINAGARSYEISRQIASVERQIEAAKSENVRLNSQLNGITSIGNIDDYATKVLGMSKVESYQVEYIDLGQDDGVLYSSGGGFLGIFSNH